MLDDDGELRALLSRARTIAVVGLSENPARPSHAVARYLVEAGYAVFPVNPGVKTVLGLESHARLEDVPVPVDIVDIFRRPRHVPAIVRSAVSVAAGAVWMQPGAVSPEAIRIAEEQGVPVVAGRCAMAEHMRLIAPSGDATIARQTRKGQ